MAISAYPRTAVQNSKSNTNKPNGLSLMIVDPVTGEYTPATAETFAGGGGGDAATATNQLTQISEAQNTRNEIETSNAYLALIKDFSEQINNRLFSNNFNGSVADLLYGYATELPAGILLEQIASALNSISNTLASMSSTLDSINGTLQNIDGNITNGQQRVVIQDTAGNTARITSNRLNVDTGA